MNINVKLDAVVKSFQTVEQTQKELVSNFEIFSKLVNENFSEWKDSNVVKFVSLHNQMTQDLNNALLRLDYIRQFCDKIYLLIKQYNEV